MIEITVHRSYGNMALCQEFAQSHQQALAKARIKNIEKIATNNTDWFDNPGVYLVLARCADTKLLLGGLRIQLANDYAPIPLAVALCHTQPEVVKWLESYRRAGRVGEICGLWNTRGRALVTEKLIIAAIAVSKQLALKHLVAFVGNHMTRLSLRLGFKVEEELGQGGKFFYPSEHYISRITSIDVHALGRASKLLRAEIDTLRAKPCQHMTYSHRGETIDYSFCLHIDASNYAEKSVRMP